MTTHNPLEALQAEIEAAQAEEKEEQDKQDNRDMQRDAADMARARDDARADDLIGRQIGCWTVIGKKARHETPSGKRAVYIVKHRGGRVKGLRGYRLNALMQEAKNGGLA
ncbi:hypothetical protein QWJ41_04160 [Nocardioides sp. SOB44]|uniref:Uncharacterized protein n=1 Tax=Nocardioides cremeus TaxID=3058044 RepID=A0ABT8TLQ9_9ACTN|nr:hypothetical protein [Nocardioides cremeus]MDO3394900.1 hypothetical protein [Nocardioides cremeus]